MFFRLSEILLILLYFGHQVACSTENNPKASTTTSLLNSASAENNHSNICNNSNPNLVKCDFNTSCVYGELNTISCHVDDDNPCKGDRSFTITFSCLYCWQLAENFYSCAQNSTCKANTKYLTTCNVNSTTYCLGHREFSRFKQCDIASGHKWSMALVLSILFGGFGVDRFYLGHWQEGVGKLFSFGGFGVWTLIDSILISIGYLKPADSSHYE